MKFSHLILLSVCVSTLTACGPRLHLEEAQYWQRKSATSALYLQGPKAQQTLHMDIATCVNEVNELKRLGSLREATPAETHNGHVPNPNTPEGKLAAWDTPERDGYLYAEHFDYHDFETCMNAKGWERVEHLPYDTAERARHVWLKTIIGEDHQTRYGSPPKHRSPYGMENGGDDYSNLND